MARVKEPDVPTEFEERWGRVFVDYPMMGYRTIYEGGEYYQLYSNRRVGPKEFESRRGLEGPFVSAAASVERSKFACAVGGFDTQRALGGVWSSYFGPRPEMWWSDESSYGGDFWFSGFVRQEIMAYGFRDLRAWQKDDAGYNATQAVELLPDTTYDWAVNEFELMTYWDAAGVKTNERRGVVAHDAIFAIEYWVKWIGRTNTVGDIGLKVYKIDAGFDETTFTWNNQPVYDTLLGTDGSVEVGERVFFDGALGEKFAFMLDTSGVSRIDPGQWGSVHVEAHAVQVGPF